MTVKRGAGPVPSSLTRRQFLRAAAISAAAAGWGQTYLLPKNGQKVGLTPSNIVLIYADDLGFGDVGCYGATKVRTPAIDALARRGLRFTNAHSPAATCTPSRYALLTGEYAWRREGTGIAAGDANLIIEPGRRTLASMLKEAGYATGVVGKWHLGLGQGPIDWNAEIRPGPADLGFDYSFLIPATGDRVPCVYVENGRVVGLDPADPIRVSYRGPVGDEPTGRDHPELLKMRPSHGHDQTIVNGVSRIGYMSGGRAARWTDETIADTITAKAVSFLERNAAGPFFLYFATHDIHVPRLPHPRFAGRSGLGPRGDAVVEFDWSVGEIVRALERLGLTENTLLVFTSDNGPVVDDGYQDRAVELLDGHAPSGPLRGGKYSAFDAGTRIPFIVRWPRRVKPGTTGALLSQVDLLASFAALTGQKLGGTDAPDSFDLSRALLGKDGRGRDHLVEQARALSIIEGRWKYIEPAPGPAVEPNTGIELGNSAGPQLYDLTNDLGETKNLAAARPEIVERLAARLAKVRRDGRSRR
jgi:arylsulfatase A-like enzyme